MKRKFLLALVCSTKQELRLPEHDHWSGQDRLPSNIEAAYRAVTANP